jgi:flagellin-like protein
MMKRGVSPLIATVLLVMIVVSIGAAVMLVIRGLTNENLEKIQQKTAEIACGADVSVHVLAVGNYYQICENTSGSSGEIQAIFVNKGTTDISDFKITAIGDSDIYDNISYDGDIINDISEGETKKLNFVYNNATTGPLRQIKLVPIVAGAPGKETVACIDTAVIWNSDQLEPCPFMS